MNTSQQIGQAGEYLTAAVLQRRFPVIAIPHIPAPYDIAVQTPGGQFLRCQVKTSDSVDHVNNCDYYRFHSNKNTGCYSADEIDFFAFVALPERVIRFEKCSDISSSGVYRLRKDQATFAYEKQSFEKTLGAFLTDQV